MLYCHRSFLLLMISLLVGSASAQDYPYANVAPQSASLTVNTSTSVPFNNLLLGLNTNFPENLYGLDGYNDSDGQALIVEWAPPSLRFPHGVWANYYDWEVDGRRIYDDYDTIYRPAVENVPQLRYGYDGFKLLHDFLGFEVLHTWNITYDSPAKGVARLLDRRADGFPVERIELGNETFWRNQRSNAVATPELYVGVASAHAAALKAVDPEIQLSVPVTWRTGGTLHGPWNAALAADQSYYDAVTLHRYITPGEPTVAGLQEVLDARRIMIQTAEDIRSQFPGKPIWLTEWSIDAGENAISVLGLFDTYLGIIDRPDLFGSAEYFQIHNHDPFIVYDRDANPKHVKTARGAAYDILRGVFLDSELVSASMTSTEITPGLAAATGKAVLKDGELVVYAINKSPVGVELDLNINGGPYSGPYTHEAFQFDIVDDFPSFGLSESALEPVSSTPGAIMLPPLSISVLSGFDPVAPPAAAVVIAGWDTWENGSNPAASVTAAGVTGSAVTSSEGVGWHVLDGRGASADGDWGTFTGLPAASTTAGEGVENENLELSNATTGGTITFTVTNSGSEAFVLDGFHFDAYAFRPKAARAYELSVVSGGITNGVIYTSADDEITSVGGAWGGNAHDDISHSLLGLADHTLETGETVSFMLAFSSGVGDNAGGHDLWVDNVAVTGSVGAISALIGDFDEDGDVDLVDLDHYNSNIGADATGELEALDLNNDGTVGADDFAQHYETLVETSNGQVGTFAGDLNLDGTVNVLGDAFALIGNLNNPATSWSQGDITGDGIVNVLGDAFLLISNLGNSNE